MAERHREPLGKVHTKIVATVGPASRDPATLRALVEAGVDVFRLNFSHGTHDEHSETLRDIRAVADECGRFVAVLQDLGGPKIRLGPIPGGAVDCALGDTFTLATERTGDDPHELTCTYCELPHDLKPGDDVVFADGAVAMVVCDCDREAGRVRLTVTLAGRVRSSQGLNLPGADLKVQALTEKDLRDLDWTAENPVEYIGLSFVRHWSDVARLRQELNGRLIPAKVVAKIEKPQALANLDAIIAEADAVMVARGDLGVEVDVARVPAIQKKIIAACHQARVPVITATQMLNSMETSNRPTRAEATDVFNAVLDGTDAVMLSGETAVGAYPVEAVSTMSRIVTEAEALLLGDPSAPWAAAGARPPGLVRGRAGWVQPITESVVEAVRFVVRRLDAKLVVVTTQSGRTALALSKQRYGPPTVALTDDPVTARVMALYWGVNPLVIPRIADQETTSDFVHDWALGNHLVARGDHVVVVQGTIPDHPSHNAMLVQLVE
jgi:pyruvate kinase